jgi:transcriptional regulator with XRE-family HTH domain
MTLQSDEARALMLDNLRWRIESQKLTQKKLCEQAGLHPNALRDILGGATVEPGVIRMKRICTALGCGVDDLFSREVRIEPRQRGLIESLSPENHGKLMDIAQIMKDAQDLARLRKVLVSDHILGVPPE